MALPLRVTVSINRIDAAPGDRFNFDVTLRNTSDIVEHYVVEMLGLPAGATARVEPDVAKLRPGETATATVQLAVPEQSPAAAGLYTLGVLVRSRYRPEVSRCEEFPLTLAAVDDLAVRVDPEVATGGRGARYTVQVTNGGNLPVRLALGASDPERRVASTFEPPVLDLPQGATAHSFLSVHAPVPWNKEKQRVLTVEAVGGGARGTGTATFVQRPRFASKLVRTAGMVGAVVAVVGAVLAGALIARGGEEEPDPGATGPPGVATSGPAVVPPASPSAAAPPSPSAPPTTEAPSPTGPPPPDPQVVDVTQPFGEPANGVLDDDAFRRRGLLISGAPEQGVRQECANAFSVAVTGDANSGRSLSAALSNNENECTDVPVLIRLRVSVSTIQVTVAGDEETRQLEVFYKDNTRFVENDLTVTPEERRTEIDFLVVRGLPAADGTVPAAQIVEIRFTPST
ncbi:COG1470 family protein [Phytohabitans sp. LJ34]|uniref:COG1470 family protein n=1 Tax=Phytohabitans sp. LJ34 TaxID=3452217 RepID=UPI003F8C8B49